MAVNSIRGKRFVIGASKLRRKLARMPGNMNIEVRKTIQSSAELVAQRMESLAAVSDSGVPVDDTGRPRQHLKDLIQVKISKNGLTARVGFIDKRVRESVKFARFLEFGARPGKEGGGPTFVKHPFVRPAWQMSQRFIQSSLRFAVKTAFKRAAGNSGG